ncbi:hypothetical protein E2C01_009335 [Portunus trituberculatus]|uniref:Uncharacterized protein n=1 Tax=Portunus trituberculatus TaxID=210409 RepID=A0A5B7D4D0_PORTR|nr:hypothetical protein [Portunus trituberculatus]
MHNLDDIARAGKTPHEHNERLTPTCHKRPLYLWKSLNRRTQFDPRLEQFTHSSPSCSSFPRDWSIMST